jgi:hypothetical protein
MKTPVLTTCLSLALTFAASAQTVWKAGAAKTVVTPSEPIWLAGYGDRTHPSQGVLRDIYVKALALEAEPGPAGGNRYGGFARLPTGDFRSRSRPL